MFNATPQLLYARERDPVPTVHEAGWIQSRSGQLHKISPLLGFDPGTVQPAASRYTDSYVFLLSVLYPYFFVLIVLHFAFCPCCTTLTTQTSMSPGEIRTRNPSKRWATDSRRRLLGHWDWLSELYQPTVYSVLDWKTRKVFCNGVSCRTEQ